MRTARSSTIGGLSWQETPLFQPEDRTRRPQWGVSASGSGGVCFWV